MRTKNGSCYLGATLKPVNAFTGFLRFFTRKTRNLFSTLIKYLVWAKVMFFLFANLNFYLEKNATLGSVFYASVRKNFIIVWPSICANAVCPQGNGAKLKQYKPLSR